MKYRAKPIEGNVNISKENTLIEFSALLVGLVIIVLGIIALIASFLTILILYIYPKIIHHEVY